jgi:hypothetical protein
MNIRVNIIFWKEGPLLFDCAQNRLLRLLTCQFEIAQSTIVGIQQFI